ncbi:hypothetical protein [Collimonas sp.]|jgi:hypothetical protein|uniref:hypothetical protein n=1 Tax=Collimonas sp. TaxID=1963772 RepID=UPI002BDF2AD8|nr:hypothetical protein [Collimonas sp.]HWW07467.1 hypothetical protein [Collimonas sp.]
MSDETRWPLAVHPRAMRWGILLSLLLHIGLMQLFWRHEAADIARPPNSQPELTLMLLPATPTTPAQVRAARVVMPPIVQRDSHPAKSSVRVNPVTPTLPAAAQESSINDAAVPHPPTVEQPRLDLDAAVKMARQIATDPDSRRNGTAVSQLQTHPLEARQPDSRLTQDIQRSARADCLDTGRSFGLLAPLAWATDAVLSKKNGGCKW